MADCTITIKGNRAFITGTYPKDILADNTSYNVKGAYFSKLYKLGRWDGKSHLFDKKTQSFSTGLVGGVVKAFKAAKIDVEVIDNTPSPPCAGNGFELKTIDFGKGRYDYQLEAAKAMLAHRRGIVKIATNGGKSSICAALAQHVGVPTLVLVPGIDLLHQTANVFAKYLGVQLEDVGMIGDGLYRIGKLITVAVLDSVVSKLESEDEHFMSVKDVWMMLILDEAHHAGSDTAFDALEALPAPLRYGVSGTPLNRSDGADLRLIAQTGDIIYEVRNKLLVERGISVQPHLHLLTHRDPILDKRMAWADVLSQGIVNNRSLNKKLVDYAHGFIKDGAQCIFMVDKIAQGELIIEFIKELKPDYQIRFMRGDLDSDTRKQYLEDFSTRKARVIVGTSVMSTGIDLNNIDMVVLCGGGKATIPQLQRIGRGLRSGSGRDKCIIVDVMSFSHKHLIKHSQARLKTYKEEDMFQISIID